jgi:hypothetical protein
LKKTAGEQVFGSAKKTRDILKKINSFIPSSQKRIVRKSWRYYRSLERQVKGGDDDLFEVAMAYEDWLVERTRLIERTSFKLDVAVPERPYGKNKDEYWELSRYYGSYFLTPAGISMVNKEIHAARTMKFESIARWVTLSATIIGTLTGLVGATIGLVAILN